MSDEVDPARQVAAYGNTAQPAIAARMAPHQRLIMIGTACAAVAVIAAAVAVVEYPSFAGADPGLAWADAALVSAVLMLAICVIQVIVWRRAMASWSGHHAQDLHGEKQLSWIAHLMSYVVALVALFTTMEGSAVAGWLSISAGLLAVSLVFVLAAQVLAGVQFLRSSGPPGTIPAHIRRLKELSRNRND
jgi:hypothetical protein